MNTGLVQPTEITEFYESLLNPDWSFSGRRWLNNVSGRDSQRKKNTYRHTPPGNTGSSPRAFQGSQVWRGRKSGTGGDALWHHPHTWHYTGSTAATGPKFLQGHQPCFQCSSLEDQNVTAPKWSSKTQILGLKEAVNKNILNDVKSWKECCWPCL